MIAFAFAVVLLLASLIGVTLEKAYFYLPTRELGRRAKRGDPISAALLGAATYEGELRTLLMAFVVVTAAAGLVLFATIAPFIFGFLVTALALALCFFWQPRQRLAPWEARLAVQCSSALVWLLTRLHPLLSRLPSLHPQSRRHTGLFELADLDELFAKQTRQRDNRIHVSELERVRSVLHMGGGKVRDIMVRPKYVVSVNEEETISPVLINDLHRSGHSRFPVYEGKKSNIIGTLTLGTIADVGQHGLVRDNIDHRLAYLHEDDSLEQALKAFYETRQHLFIAVNDRGEYVGIVTVTDVLKRVLGNLEHAAFGKHDDKEAVAARHNFQQRVAKKETEVVQ